MVTVTNATVRSNIFENIYDGLTTEMTGWTVTSSFIDNSKGENFTDQIVINPIQIGSQQIVLNRSLKEQPVVIRIDIYSKKAKRIDEATDKIANYFNTNETSIADNNGLDDMQFVDNEGDTFYLNQQKIHTKTLALNFTKWS